MQAVPEATVPDIITALHQASDRFLAPDSLYGYGIPDIGRAIGLLQEKLLIRPEKGPVLYPNPFTSIARITFRETPSRLTVEVYNAAGRLLYKSEYEEYVGRSVSLDVFREFPDGVYFVRIITQGGITVQKAIKIRI
jgi:hypothetical protein